MSSSSTAASRQLMYVDPAGFTPHFRWQRVGGRTLRGKEVACEKVLLSSVAEKFGTPCYVYSSAAIKDAYSELDRGLGALSHTICFAIKSNGNLSILKLLANMGSGFDIVSGGELEYLAHLGVRGDRIVFSGVGKSRYEICDIEERSTAGTVGSCFSMLNPKRSSKFSKRSRRDRSKKAVEHHR
jgi:hypothetical protein